MNKTKNTIEMGTFNFYIIGEDYTWTVRDFWKEGSIRKSKILVIDTMLDENHKKILTDEDFLNIVTGKKKFVGNSNNGDLCISDDIPTPDLSVETMEQQLRNNIVDYVEKRNSEILLMKEEGWLQEEIDEEIKEIDKKISSIVSELTELYSIAGIQKDISSLFLTTNGYGIQSERRMKLEEKILYEEERPLQTSIIDKWNGWLSPDGIFYECGHMEHISLADDLFEYKIVSLVTKNETKEHGIFGVNYENIIEHRGWVKLSGGQFHMYGYKRKITNKQKDVIFDWANRDKRTSVTINSNSIPLNKLYEEDLERI